MAQLYEVSITPCKDMLSNTQLATLAVAKHYNSGNFKTMMNAPSVNFTKIPNIFSDVPTPGLLQYGHNLLKN